MKAVQQLTSTLTTSGQTAFRSAQIFLRDVGQGLLEVSHNGLAFFGLVVAAALLFVASQSHLRHSVESHVLGWLQERYDSRTLGTMEALANLNEPQAITRATAIDPKELNQEQAAVAQWLSRRYRVAPEPVGRLVHEAWHVGARAGLDPTLILAIVAIESSFNPFAQSSVGAQGLMQVMTRVHDDKYVAFGGNHAAFDPVTNLRVGVQVLKECIARAGSLEGGLRYYVGAANLPHDGGYAGKVLAEQAHLRMVAAGRTVAFNAPIIPAPTTVPVSIQSPDPDALPAQKDDAEQVALLN